MSFSELYLIYYPKLVRFAKEFVMSEEDAENITQDVFTDLWEKRESMNHIENMNAYLFRLVRNKCLDYLKHKVFEQKYVENVKASFEIELNLKLQSLDRFDVYDISERNQMEKLIRDAIISCKVLYFPMMTSKQETISLSRGFNGNKSSFGLSA